MKKIILALIMIMFIIGCKGNSITGGAVIDAKSFVSEEEKAPVKEVAKEQKTGLNDCQDNDGLVSGHKEGKVFNLRDRCIGGISVDYYCDGNTPSNKNVVCQGACDSGSCV